MTTFSISLPEQDQAIIDEIAKREHRSRTQQIQLIIEEWLKKQPMRIQT
jgi:predicted transcriptional regulator